MDETRLTGDGWGRSRAPRLLWAAGACGFVFAELAGSAQDRGSLAGEEAAQALKQSLAAEDYNWAVGPVRFRTEAGLRLGYTDNVFFSDEDRREDFLANPEVALRALWPISELNTLRLSLGLGYEWYLNNTDLNSDAPLINPDTELVFHIFVGDFRIRLREKFSYQESLFYNSGPGTERFFNFTDVGKFTRWNNRAGLEVVGDLNRVVLSVRYDHENFIPVTQRFEYMERTSEWFDAAAAFPIGDQVQVGVEGQGGLHDYEQETTLNDNWRTRGGPFFELNAEQKISLRAGGGFEAARFDAPSAENNNFEDYYAYVRIRQETRLFAHSLTAAREHLLGDNADNLRLTQIRYSISSPVFRHVDLGADLSVNFAEEFGGTFREEFTYYRASFELGWQFHKYWRTSLGYEFLLKDSDLPLRDFDRNRATWALAFSY